MHVDYLKMFVLLTACTGLLSCATDQREVVVSTIEPSSTWSMDAAQYISYKDSVTRARLLLSANVIPAQVDSLSLTKRQPLEFSILIDSSLGVSESLTIEPSATTIDVAGDQIKPANAKICGTANTLDLITPIAPKSFNGAERGYICFLITYEIPRPSDWSSVVLRIGGLKRNGKNIPVPDIRFKTERRLIAKCGTPTASGGFLCVRGN